MIESRRCPKATGPCATTPSESGPRADIAPVIRVTAATSADRPSKVTSPQIPHINRDHIATATPDARAQVPSQP